MYKLKIENMPELNIDNMDESLIEFILRGYEDYAFEIRNDALLLMFGTISAKTLWEVFIAVHTTSKTYGTYAKDSDMTFIIKDTYVLDEVSQTEVTGFLYGNNVEEINEAIKTNNTEFLKPYLNTTMIY